jgi:TetR/AcrR family transcriptional regulator, transcriptional repressor for nem operon
MGRPKEFDTDVACDAALGLFWRLGYEATSVNDLVAELGIAKASLYATFGTKHELYLTALKRYIERSNTRVMADLTSAGQALPAVRGLVHRYVDEALADNGRIGCLVVNAAMELLPRDAEVGLLVERTWETLEAALTLALTMARAQGDLPDGHDPAGLARFLLTFLQGLRVVGKGTDAEQRLRDAAEVALTVLGPA